MLNAECLSSHYKSSFLPGWRETDRAATVVVQQPQDADVALRNSISGIALGVISLTGSHSYLQGYPCSCRLPTSTVMSYCSHCILPIMDNNPFFSQRVSGRPTAPLLLPFMWGSIITVRVRQWRWSYCTVLYCWDTQIVEPVGTIRKMSMGHGPVGITWQSFICFIST